jgi:hypothetical protein
MPYFDPKAEADEYAALCRRIYRCKGCKTTVTQDEAVIIKKVIERSMLTVQGKRTEVRRVGNHVYPLSFAGFIKCGTCGKDVWGGQYLNVGTKTKHKCDKRCVNAAGHECNCECGGLLHGTGLSLDGKDE